MSCSQLTLLGFIRSYMLVKNKRRKLIHNSNIIYVQYKYRFDIKPQQNEINYFKHMYAYSQRGYNIFFHA